MKKENNELSIFTKNGWLVHMEHKKAHARARTTASPIYLTIVLKTNYKECMPDPSCCTYAGGVVSRETVQIALTYAALNDVVPVMAADIWNAYLQAPSSLKHFIICGLGFGIENVC